MTMDGISDDKIIEEAVRFVREGLSVTLAVKGSSMLPFILGGRESVVLTQPGDVRRGDVVLARIDGRRFVLHRVMDVSGDRVELMGDGNIAGREVCTLDDVLARADEVVGADGRHRRLDSKGSRAAARLWRFLLPVRRWILAVYRRTIIRNIEIR